MFKNLDVCCVFLVIIGWYGLFNESYVIVWVVCFWKGGYFNIRGCDIDEVYCIGFD